MTDNQREHRRASDPPEPAPTGPAPADDRRTMRRRLVKAGLVALPAVLTLRARPAWAQDGTGGMTGNTPVPPAQQGGQSENLWQGQSPWAEEPWSEDSWSGNPWAEDPGWEEGSAEEGSWGE